ncbi:E1 [Eidolon helvum papillomavirus 2]|uniref:Replication protein E1 n=1 Tax=Eidolon helvum papillomavirus 2 TaxID=1335476 RepID=A0A1P8YVV0_9PAPI|nr:E1 [Eidolon helvum papillomavirus 2]AQA28217.1 E1 [Eidolon helvum papillomavirus 2]
MASKGTDPDEGTSGMAFVSREADVSGEDSSDADEEGSDAESMISDLFDDTDQAQGNTQALFQQLQAQDDERIVQALKRKHLGTPEGATALNALSPRLEGMQISPPRRPGVKKKLFTSSVEDSGVGISLEQTNEAEDISAVLREKVEGEDGRVAGDGAEQEPAVELEVLTQHSVPSDLPSDITPDISGTSGEQEGTTESTETAETENGLMTAILNAKNKRACMLGAFKSVFQVSFCDLVRQYRSDKTCSNAWVIAVLGLHEAYYDILKTALPQHCTFSHMQYRAEREGCIGLMLLEFTAAKNRDTVKKLLKTLAGVKEEFTLLQPPNIRSPAAAMYWVERSYSNLTDKQGPYPDWITRQTTLAMQTEEVAFDFSRMVQWAYDQKYMDESTIAYYYAQHAEEDANAMAWLRTSTQAKHVRDCAVMVRHYYTAQMREMTMAQWIAHRCEQVTEEGGDWKPVIKFLRLQGVEVIPWLRHMRDWLKGIPKKNCLCYWGPPNSGKSMFCMSMVRFLAGAVLSYVNAKSQFWLQPVSTAKVALLDDATRPAWAYIDIHLRNLVDGNPVSLDLKHKAPVQIVCPPMLITTNIDISTDEHLKYLYSRIKCISFPCALPLDSKGNPTLLLTDKHWKSFFTHFAQHQEIEVEEDEDGLSQRSFKCSARTDTDSL